MDILNTVSLESNSQIKINFDGGDLSLLFTGWGNDRCFVGNCLKR